jgi:hypothetical protein
MDFVCITGMCELYDTLGLKKNSQPERVLAMCN